MLRIDRYPVPYVRVHWYWYRYLPTYFMVWYLGTGRNDRTVSTRVADSVYFWLDPDFANQSMTNRIRIFPWYGTYMVSKAVQFFHKTLTFLQIFFMFIFVPAKLKKLIKLNVCRYGYLPHLFIYSFLHSRGRIRILFR